MRALFSLAIAVVVGCAGTAAVAQSPSPTTAGAPTAVAASPAATATPRPPLSFADLVKQGKLASYKIAYRYSFVGGSETVTTAQTQYAKPPKLRWDLSSPTGSVSMFFLEDGIYLCTAEGAAPACLKLPAPQAAPQNRGAQVTELAREYPERFNTVPQSTRVIAGIETQCFAASDTTAGGFGSGTFCYSAQGLPLFTQFKGALGDFAMEATSVSTSVSDADFTLPAPVRSLP